MKEKDERLLALKEIIRNNKIDSQDVLIRKLQEKGFELTQATLSRDLRAIKVGKISDGWSGYYYSLPEKDGVGDEQMGFIHDVRRGVVSIEFSGNIGVIKTISGHANSVAYALDALGMPEILGTLAGDDTIFVLLREGMTKEDLLQEFRKKVPEIDK